MYYFSLNGQNLSREYVESWIISTFLIPAVDTNAAIYLNGEYLSRGDCDYILNDYLQDDLIQVYFIDASEDNSVHNDHDLILIWTTGSQSKKTIKEKYKIARKKYKNVKSTLNVPVLVINDTIVEHSECFEAIREINLSEIIGIGVYHRSVSEEIYGKKAVNGLVILKTK